MAKVLKNSDFIITDDYNRKIFKNDEIRLVISNHIFLSSNCGRKIEIDWRDIQKISPIRKYEEKIR